MKKIIALSLYCVASMSVWATQSLTPMHSLLPLNNQIKNLTPLSISPAHVISSTILVKAGGYGGNNRIGQLTYIGISNTLPALSVIRDANSGICYLRNKNVIVKNNNDNLLIQFNCFKRDPEHYYLYWAADLGAVNGGYSPENDTLYAGDVVTNMFMDWYGIPPLKDRDGMKMPITFKLHRHIDNAWIYGDELIIGDGIRVNYPFTSLTTLSYMVGGLFTQQHAHLDWQASQAGGIDVAFNCMTAMAAEFYASGKNTWQLGAEIAKDGQAIHYMDIPSKNCQERKPGDDCDIDTLAQYKNGMSGFYSSGLFNRAFYLLATTSEWNTHKAYNVFVQANRFYWTAHTDFHRGACGVVAAAQEIGYDKMSVMRAFSRVGIDTRDC